MQLLFVVSPSVSQAFWILQAMTAIVYMGMYLLLSAAAWRLRTKEPDAVRAFRVPALPLVAIVGAIAAASAIFIGLVPPSQFGNESPALYAGILLIGVAILALPPQIIDRIKRPAWRDPRLAEGSTED
jgi:amino acid transporter